MIERIRAGAHRVAGTLWTIGVDRDLLTHRMSYVHGGLHLIVSEGLLCGNVLESADGPVHLDDVRPSRDLPPDHFHHFFRRIGGPAAFRWRSAWAEWGHDAEPVPADEHPGAVSATIRCNCWPRGRVPGVRSQ